jgi:hypothetical protein
MAIKIRIVKDPETGEDCVPPKVMELLTSLASHRDICPQCEAAHSNEGGCFKDWCPIGQAFLEELSRQPEVESA